MPNAILLGSIGVLAETSHFQRDAFNAAFTEAGLNWHWDEHEYARLLQSSGGQKRIENYARDHGETVDAEALHTRKTAVFQDRLAEGIPPREGVRDVIDAAKAEGVPIGFVTTTSEENVREILAATDISPKTFAFIGHGDMVRIGKPSAEIYRLALQHLGVEAADSIAVEDSAPSARAAQAADIPLVAFPGAMHAGDDFGKVVATTDHLTPAQLGLGAKDRAVA